MLNITQPGQLLRAAILWPAGDDIVSQYIQLMPFMKIHGDVGLLAFQFDI